MVFEFLIKIIKEFYKRIFIIISILTILILIILNIVWFINNYLFFFNEIQLNEIEYYYLHNLKYNNSVIHYINYEYDWYLDYNIYFSKTGTFNITVKLYFINIIILIIPYIIYEMYLFYIPALLKHEKIKFQTWIIYTIVNNLIYYLIIAKNIIYNFFFYWNEDTFIYLENELIDIFININQLSKIHFILYILNIIISQYFFFKPIIYNINFIFIIRYFFSSIIIWVLISIFLEIPIIILYQFIAYWLFYIEIYIFIIYIKIYYKLLYY